MDAPTKPVVDMHAFNPSFGETDAAWALHRAGLELRIAKAIAWKLTKRQQRAVYEQIVAKLDRLKVYSDS